MKLPLSKAEYKAFQKLAEECGLTVDQLTQLAILRFFKERDSTIFEAAKKHADPEVLRRLENS